MIHVDLSARAEYQRFAWVAQAPRWPGAAPQLEAVSPLLPRWWAWAWALGAAVELGEALMEEGEWSPPRPPPPPRWLAADERPPHRITLVDIRRGPWCRTHGAPHAECSEAVREGATPARELEADALANLRWPPGTVFSEHSCKRAVDGPRVCGGRMGWIPGMAANYYLCERCGAKERGLL